MAKILLVEDKSTVRSALRIILERVGHEVFEASDGAEGVKICREHNADLVVTDVVMPDIDGIQMLTELKRDFPQIPVIAMSGGGNVRNLDFPALAVEFGAQKVLTKPFFPKDLIDAVNGAMMPEAICA